MVSYQPAAVIVLAAGAGTRMKSRTPKVLHEIGGRSLVGHALTAAASLEPRRLVVVVRHERERVAEHIAEVAPTALVVDQDEVPGTGRAVQCALTALPEEDGVVVVTYGDVPLLRPQTLERLVHEHVDGGHAVTVLTATVDDPSGYGRILREGSDVEDVTGIVEHKDANAEQLAITEVNSGIYAFDAAVLRSALSRVGSANAQGEVYLTDVLGIARADGGRVRGVHVAESIEVEGANDRVQLAALGAELNRRLLETLMLSGVTVVDPASVRVDADVSVGTDTVLEPGVYLYGATTIGAECHVGPMVTVRDSEVGDRVRVRASDINTAEIGDDARIGPMAAVRAGSEIANGAWITPFTEASVTPRP